MMHIVEHGYHLKHFQRCKTKKRACHNTHQASSQHQSWYQWLFQLFQLVQSDAR